MKYSDGERVKQARSNVYTAYLRYTTDPTDERQEEVSQKIKTFKDVYTTIFGEERNHEITLIERTNRTNKHQESCKIINEMTRRKRTKRAILKGRNKEQRIKNWYDYFKELPS